MSDWLAGTHVWGWRYCRLLVAYISHWRISCASLSVGIVLRPRDLCLLESLRDGQLYGGRDPKKPKRLLPLTSDAFVLSGSLGEWLFVTEKGRAVRIVNVRKFQPLVWTRVEEGR